MSKSEKCAKVQLIYINIYIWYIKKMAMRALQRLLLYAHSHTNIQVALHSNLADVAKTMIMMHA